MNTVITASQLIMINMVNGVLFAYIYGLIGYAVDRKLATEKKSMPALRMPVHTATSK